MSQQRHVEPNRHAFVQALETTLASSCGVGAGDRLLLAVSGGADSVAMLRAMAALATRPHWSLQLEVAHVHHHLRPEADEEAKWTGRLSAELGLPHHHRDIHPADSPGNLEAEARRLRYEALADVARACEADLIATAHHADDQLETLLMRLIRGSGLRGMAGIRPRSVRRPLPCPVIRPLLGCTHDQAVAFLSEIGQTWREDPTNRHTDRWRSRLRQDVLPVLRQLRADASIQATETAIRLQAADRALAEAADRAERHCVRRTGPHEAVIDRQAARSLPAPLLRELIERTCADVSPADGGGAGRGRQFDAIAEAARDARGDRRRFEVDGRILAVVDRDALSFTAARE